MAVSSKTALDNPFVPVFKAYDRLIAETRCLDAAIDKAMEDAGFGEGWEDSDQEKVESIIGTVRRLYPISVRGDLTETENKILQAYENVAIKLFPEGVCGRATVLAMFEKSRAGHAATRRNLIESARKQFVE